MRSARTVFAVRLSQVERQLIFALARSRGVPAGELLRDLAIDEARRADLQLEAKVPELTAPARP